jgi:ORF6N domain
MNEASLIPAARIEQRILLIRGQKVMLDSDLAKLYGVETKVLNQAVKRNVERFPEDFMFQLSWEEARFALRSQIVTLEGQKTGITLKKMGNLRSQIVTLESGRNPKYRSYAFTEQGVAMLSSVLSSSRAIHVNIAIMRAFVQLRQMLASHADLSRKLAVLENRYDAQFKIVFDAIRELMKPAVEKKPKRKIGFDAIMNDRDAKTTARSRTRISA